jgi:nicotinate-nucleotide adenylyltransferase
VGQKIGILGGTFDPVHWGHLILAEQARESLALDRVLLVPAAASPRKRDRTPTLAKHRLTMLELAVAGNPGLGVDEIELDREGPSFTVDTLRLLREQRPGDELFFLIGADNFFDLPHWREPVEIARLATIAVARRPGQPPLDPKRLAPPFSPQAARAIADRVVEIPLIGISATEIRRRRAEGKSIRYLLPASVEAYIFAHDLYRTADDSIDPEPHRCAERP